MYEVKEKVFFVTGGAAGIGAGVAKALLEEGAKHVAILDIDITNGKSLEQELISKYGEKKAKFHKCDVTTQDLESAYNDVINQYGYIDVVINNAGILNDSPNCYEKMIAVNVTALITSSLKAYNHMRKDRGGKGGTIVNVSSIAGIYQTPLWPIYCATKSAVLQFSNCLGMEPHYPRSGVRVVTMCFGCTKSSLFSDEKLGTMDKETDQFVPAALENCNWQGIESAVNGLIHAYKNGSSGSTWLVRAEKQAQDITSHVTKAYEVMSQGMRA